MQNKKIKHVMQWHITHRCNLRCSHCYQEEFGSELSFNELEKLFYQYMDFCDNNSFRGHINFTGGEPLLSEHLFPLLELCNKNDVTFGLLSAAVMQFAAESFVGLFAKNNADVIRLGGQYLRGYVWDCVFAGIHFCFSGYFCACGRSGFSFLHNSGF